MSDVEFFGETLRLNPAEDVEYAMLEFAEVAQDTEAEGLAGAAAVMNLLKAAIHEDDLPRFRALCRKHKARTERDLMPIVVAVFEQETARPTSRPSDSSDGPSPTSVTSVGGSSSPVIARLEANGRPDLALIVDMASRASA